MITLLFLLSSDYIYGKGHNGADPHAKAEITHNVPLDAEEGTAYEAIVRTNQNNLGSKLNLFNLSATDTLMGLPGYPAVNLFPEGKSNNLLLSSEKNDSDNQVTDSTSKADSDQAGAVAKITVDSSSTMKDNQKTVTATTVAAKNTKKLKTESTKDSVKDSKETMKKAKEPESKDTKKSDKEKKNEYVIDLSNKDIEILQRIVEAEATGEDMKGKMLVANVILNRVKDKDFPDTIKGVVFQKDGGTYQFSPIKDNRYWTVKISKDTAKAVDRVMKGEDDSKGALYFSARSRANKNSMRWFDNHLDYLFRYGGHEFFK
jgi:N-acetylmuramoyl-L-alanine amidase